MGERDPDAAGGEDVPDDGRGGPDGMEATTKKPKGEKEMKKVRHVDWKYFFCCEDHKKVYGYENVSNKMTVKNCYAYTCRGYT